MNLLNKEIFDSLPSLFLKKLLKLWPKMTSIVYCHPAVCHNNVKMKDAHMFQERSLGKGPGLEHPLEVKSCPQSKLYGSRIIFKYFALMWRRCGSAIPPVFQWMWEKVYHATLTRGGVPFDHHWFTSQFNAAVQLKINKNKLELDNFQIIIQRT